MRRAVVAAGKNKRPRASLLSSDEQQILDLILSKEGSGIPPREIKYQLKMPDPVITKANINLLANGLIKEVKGIQRGGAARKIYMGVKFTPSDVVSGGILYQNGKINPVLVDLLKRLCRMHVLNSKVATLEGLHKAVLEALHKAVLEGQVEKGEIYKPQLTEFLTSMVLDNELLEVKSTGLGVLFRIPKRETCYKLPSATAGGAIKDSITGAFASIPCGVCPRISLCTPDGVISPITCLYYNKWVDIKL